MLSPGDKVRDYEVIAPLGSGGMATLYLARRRGVGGFSRLVTLKLVHSHLLEDRNIVQLFLDEARISANVAHPNVVHVEEVGKFGGSYFIAMEYVHGVSLAKLLERLAERRLCLRPKLCVWIAAQIAEALHAAHEAKSQDGGALSIVHRDVSPQNVLVSDTGHVKLIDFGVARSLAEDDRNAAERGVLGKLRYMSPEQLRLEPSDRRSDIYALGVMLWEMLAGRSLLRCQHADDDRDWATRENPPPPSRYSSHAMPTLDRVVLKAIACDPSKRYESAFAFRAALLQADPAAVKLDAPMVAALMRSMLGGELDSMRASWPSEVAGQFAERADPTMPSYRIEDLTAETFTIPALDLMRNGIPLSATASGPVPPVAEPHEDSTGALPQSAIDTFNCPPVVVPPSEPLVRGRTLRAAAMGAVCLLSGVFLGNLLSGSGRSLLEPVPPVVATTLAAPAVDPVKAIDAAGECERILHDDFKLASTTPSRDTALVETRQLAEEEREFAQAEPARASDWKEPRIKERRYSAKASKKLAKSSASRSKSRRER